MLYGLGMDEIFVHYAEYIKKKYDAEPGFITMNMPRMVDMCERLGIENPIICSSINKIGFRMSGSIIWRVILDGLGANTFEVSYTGRVPWSGLDRYILDVAPYFDLTLSGGLSVEIFSVGRDFSVNIMQRSPVTEYVDRFSALLRECGIEYIAESPEHFSLCPFHLPG